MAEPYSDRRRRIVSGLIILVLAVMSIDALPSNTRFHDELKERVDPLVDLTGTWQGSWNLFSPNPDSRNEELFATIDYSDGSSQTWSSPDWRSRSPFHRFLSFRELEYYDNVVSGASPRLFARLADHILESVPAAPGALVETVTIEVRWSRIDDPEREFAGLDGYLEPRNRRVIHVERYR